VWRKRPAGCLLGKASQFAAEGRDPTAFVIAPRSVSLLGRTDHRPSPTLPTLPHPPVKLVKINMPGQHEQVGGDEFLTPSSGFGEPPAGYGPGALHADIVAASCDS
jgi:hypothetical protein